MYLNLKKKRKREESGSQGVIDMDSHPAKGKAGNASSIRLTARLTTRHFPACLGVADVGAASGAQCLGQCTQLSTGRELQIHQNSEKWPATLSRSEYLYQGEVE